jgi:hypothetical protein
MLAVPLCSDILASLMVCMAVFAVVKFVAAVLMGCLSWRLFIQCVAQTEQGGKGCVFCVGLCFSVMGTSTPHATECCSLLCIENGTWVKGAQGTAVGDGGAVPAIAYPRTTSGGFAVRHLLLLLLPRAPSPNPSPVRHG